MRPMPLRRAAALLLMLGSCIHGEGLTLPKEASRVPADQITTLLKETQSGVAARRRALILDDTAWADFWAQVYARQMPVPDRPAVNFTESMVIVAATGTRPNGGYGIDLDALGRVGDDYHVVVRESSLARNCTVTQVVSNPVIAVRVARTNGRVSFIETNATLRC